MTHSSVSQAVEVVRGRLREGLLRPREGWKRAAETVWGPLLTLAILIALDLLTRAGTPVQHPFPLLLLSVVVSASLGGLRTALVSAAVYASGSIWILCFTLLDSPETWAWGIVIGVASTCAYLFARRRPAVEPGT